MADLTTPETDIPQRPTMDLIRSGLSARKRREARLRW